MLILKWDEKYLESIMSLLSELDDSLGVSQSIDKKLILEHYYEMEKHPEI